MESGSNQSKEAFELDKLNRGAETSPTESGERIFTNVETNPVSQSPPQQSVQIAQDPLANVAEITDGVHEEKSTKHDASGVDGHHLAAEDVDLIERVWVDKAKAIVEQTKNDPYLQNKEMNKVKAKYIESRWRKKIKLADDAAQT